MNRFVLFFLLLLSQAITAQQLFHPSEYVNSFIGTGGHGHTYPGASVPFGMVQLSPDTRLDGWDGCSGYHASDSVIYGFTHTHLSGTGCLDYGDILFMPVTGKITFSNKEYSSSFDHAKEKAEAGFYQVFLEKYGITAELTATKRAGMHRYSFPASDSAGILLDLAHRDKVIASSLKIISDTEIEGMRISSEWAEKQIVYFVARFSKPFDSFILNNGTSSRQVSGKDIKARFNFHTLKNSKILVKVGISAVSAEGARKNLEAEIPGWDFEIVRDHAMDDWNRELGKIVVKSENKDQLSTFYTALYHSMLSPNLYMDVDGSYRGRDSLIHKTNGFEYYTVFSLWDTYRAEHPLFTIIDQKRTNDFINTFLMQYKQSGLLPVWELSANETFCMIGYHSVPVIADAYIKGIRNYDADLALDAMKNSALKDHLGLSFYKSLGFIPAEQEGESVSKTLEYSYDDWCIAQTAKAMGKSDDYKAFIKRGQYYKNILDPETGFMRAKMYNSWFSPFNPAEVNFNYTEANSWQYSFCVPQDISGLMSFLGGKDKFIKKLDALFTADTATTGRVQSDITGLIGQYAQGNEPSHHMSYLYDYAGQPWKTQELIHRISRDLYKNSKDGLCGNEDCGQMSAWYVFSAMGFYPVTPASGIYTIGTPLFSEVTINLENGKKFIIRAENLSENNFYIQSAELNGEKYSRCFITHEDIMKGGEIVFSMGNKPSEKWGTGKKDIPVSGINEDLITPVPAFRTSSRTFTGSMTIALDDLLKDAKIHYTTDGTEPTKDAPVYKKPFKIGNTTTVKATAFSKGKEAGKSISTTFMKLPENRTITHKTAWAPQYSAGGENALIDFIRGTKNFRTGTWQGYEGVDLDVTIDLGKLTKLDSVSAGFLQDQGSWIFFPVSVSFSVSSDGNIYSNPVTINNDIPAGEKGMLIKDFTAGFGKTEVRYIRVVAKNMGKCPVWHPGAGYNAWLFADEITIKNE